MPGPLYKTILARNRPKRAKQRRILINKTRSLFSFSHSRTWSVTVAQRYVSASSEYRERTLSVYQFFFKNLFDRIIRLCLSIWNWSPQAYHELRGSGMLVLPSGRLLQLYKNSIKQEPGLNKEVFKLMRQEAEKKQITKIQKRGGVMLDEMSIQVTWKFLVTSWFAGVKFLF